MSPLILLATLGWAQDASYDRLFGPEATEAAQAGESTIPAGGWAWPALLAGAGVAAAWHLRRKALAGDASLGMKVLQRQVLGDKSSLVLVEVADGHGGARRLLLGSSPTGVALVQDLGERVEEAPVAPELAHAAPFAPGANGQPARAPAVTKGPATAASRARIDAFARVLDEVMEERGLDDAEPTRPAPSEPSFDEHEFFASAPTTRGARFFSEDDLAEEATSEPALGAVAVPAAPRGPVPVAAAPPVLAPVAPRARVPAPAAVPVSRAVASAAPPPSPTASPAAPTPERRGLVALLGGKAVESPRGRVFSASGVSQPVNKTSHGAPPRPPARSADGAPQERPAFVAAPVSLPPAAATPASPAPVRVGPPLQDPRLLAAPAPLALVPDPGAPEAPVPSTRELLARLAQREQARATGTHGAPSRSASLDDRLRRFEAVVAEAGRR